MCPLMFYTLPLEAIETKNHNWVCDWLLRHKCPIINMVTLLRNFKIVFLLLFWYDGQIYCVSLVLKIQDCFFKMLSLSFLVKQLRNMLHNILLHFLLLVQKMKHSNKGGKSNSHLNNIEWRHVIFHCSHLCLHKFI
jgi:hypothetical protein